MNASRRMLVRQWQLVRTLSASRYGLSIKQLMRETGRSRNTVYRDLTLLKEAGVPLISEVNEGEARHRLLRQEELPQLGLNACQVAALHLARTQLAPIDGTDLVAELDALLAKVRAPARQTSFRFADRSRSQPEILRAIESAQRSRRRARIEYRAASRSGQIAQVHIEPLLLNVADSDPYVHAYCVERGAERTYKLARIVTAAVTKQPASHRPERPPEQAFERSVKAWTGSLTTVKVRLDAEVAWLAPEYPLVSDQVLKKCRDGRLVVEAHVAGIVEASRWVLSWGGAAEALAPLELREATRRELAKALGKYDGPGPVKAERKKTTRKETRRLTQAGTGRG